MKNRMKKLLMLLVCICMFTSGAAYAQEQIESGADGSQDGNANTTAVEINETNFPDENFRNAVKEFDTNKDGTLSTDEIKEVKKITVIKKNISNLAGIEHFISLEWLNCNFNQLTSLDVSKNVNLHHFKCDENQLKNLDVSKNIELYQLSCGGNELTTLDVSNNTKLIDLDCGENQLKNLDVSKNMRLNVLYCSNNQLTALDVSKHIDLVELSCDGNELTSLDVRNCNRLYQLDVRPLEKADVQYTAEPEWFFYGNNFYGDDSDINISVKTDLADVNARTNEIDSKAIRDEFGIDENDNAEVIVEQEEASPASQKHIMDYAGKFGGKVLKIYEIAMKLYKDGNYHDTITENFGKLTLSFYIGKEYAGKTAIVYQLHGADEIIPHKNLTVGNNGMVTITVTKLSAFGIALQDSAGGTTGPNNNTGTGGDANINAAGGTTSADNANTNSAADANGTAPTTGDAANMTVWIALIMLTMTVIPIVAIAGRRQRR